MFIEVEDTTRALQDLAREVRRRSGAKVVAITGSAGKTTTKEIAATLLARRFTTFRNRGNLNNHIGLPLSLLELRSCPEVAGVELGMNHPGEIRTLVGVAEPDVRVWTNVGDAHLGFFASADAIADAKAEIFESLEPEADLAQLHRHRVQIHPVHTARDDLVQRYPDSPYGRQAVNRIRLAEDALAASEMSVGRYYQQRNNQVGAINRYKVVVTE